MEKLVDFRQNPFHDIWYIFVKSSAKSCHMEGQMSYALTKFAEVHYINIVEYANKKGRSRPDAEIDNMC